MAAKRPPGYLLHKSTGQARVRIGGKDLYLGEYGSPESRDRYDELIREWFSQQGDVDGVSLKIDDLALLYLQHAEQHYRKDGEPTSELQLVKTALRLVVKRFGRTRARGFGPKRLKEVRQQMIDAGWARKSINQHVGRIRRAFRWGVAEELLPVEVYQALATVTGLQAGRTEARETEAIQPVPEATVEATLPHLSPVVAAMVRLQLLTGMRPGEVCSLRPCDVTISTDGLWVYRPSSHKSSHRGIDRRIFIGPAGQEVLRPFLDRPAEKHCFSPAESQAAHDAERRANRQTPMTPSQAARKPAGSRRLREKFTKDSYRRAIERGCEKAFDMPRELRDIRRTVARMTDATERQQKAERERLSAAASAWRSEFCWAPNQLRHTAGTLIRKLYGLEAAQVVLGHSDAGVTQIYAERDASTAAKIMREIG